MIKLMDLLNEGKQVAGKYDKLDTIINNILRA